MGLSLLFLFSINTFPEKQLLIYHDYGDLLFLFEHFTLKNNRIKPKDRDRYSDSSFRQGPSLKGQSLERRCSSRTFRYGYLVTT